MNIANKEEQKPTESGVSHISKRKVGVSDNARATLAEHLASMKLLQSESRTQVRPKKKVDRTKIKQSRKQRKK